MKPLARLFTLALALFALALAGCAPLRRPEQPSQERWLPLDSRVTLGQTLTANFAGLQDVELLLRPRQAGDATLRLALRASPQSPQEIAVSRLPLSQVQTQGWYPLLFAPQIGSSQRDYYLTIQLEGPGSLEVGAASASAYLDGALYLDGAPQEAQLSFLLAYDSWQAARGLAGDALRWSLFILGGFALFALPGWALLAWLWPGWERRSCLEKLALAGGLGLGLYPALLAWLDLVNLRPGAWLAWLLPAAGALGLLLRNRQQLPGPAAWRRSLTGLSAAEWTALLLLGLVFGSRFWVIRTLAAPMWGDSVQHAVMTRLILDHGGLFQSWQPYAPYQSLTIQFGFSAQAALLAWLSGLDAVQAALWTGQWLNGFAVLALYPLATRIAGGNRWAGAGAILAAGLLSQMPAYYVNWGRYAQLAGQAVLPAAAWLLWDSLDTPRPGRATLAAQSLLAGLALTGAVFGYFRMAFFYAAFALLWLGTLAATAWKSRREAWLTAAIRLGLTAAAALAWFAPWLGRLAGSSLAGYIEAGVTGGSPQARLQAELEAWRQTFDYFSPALLALCAAAVLWSLLRREWLPASLPLWAGLLVAYMAGGLLRLPGANQLQTFAIQIALYIPAGLLLGWLAARLADALSGWRPAWAAPLGMLVLLAAGGWGAVQQRALAEPARFALVTRPDLRAMAWIRANTPPESRFLVQGFRIYGGNSAVGSDAGWWLPLLAGRQNSLPPQYALVNEVPDPPDYSRRVVELVAALEAAPLDTPAGLQAACREGVTHVYIGQGQGQVGAGAAALFTPAEFQANPAFSLRYRQDRVFIYALEPGACEGLP